MDAQGGFKSTLNGRVLTGQTREVVFNVYNFMEKEGIADRFIINAKKVRERVSAACGVSPRTVTRLKAEKRHLELEGTNASFATPNKTRKVPKKVTGLDAFDLGVVRRIVNDFYVTEKCSPSVKKIKMKLEKEIQFVGSTGSVRRILKNIGYKWEKTKTNKHVLVGSTSLEVTNRNASHLGAARRIMSSTETFHSKKEAAQKGGDKTGENASKKNLTETDEDSSCEDDESKRKKAKRTLSCCAKGCQNTSDNRLMFLIPKEPVLRKKWIHNIHREGWAPSEDSALCEIHFVANQREQDPQDGGLLKPTAIPTEYLTGDAWASGPSTGFTSGCGVSDWTGPEGNNDLMEIEEHNVFIKQEYEDSDMNLNQEENQGLSIEETAKGFETVFVDSNVIKNEDKEGSPIIKQEVMDEDVDEQVNIFSGDVENAPAAIAGTVGHYPTLTTSPVTCSSAPTVSVVTTFPSSMTTTTVSAITGLISAAPVLPLQHITTVGHSSTSPLVVPVISQPIATAGKKISPPLMVANIPNVMTQHMMKIPGNRLPFVPQNVTVLPSNVRVRPIVTPGNKQTGPQQYLIVCPPPVQENLKLQQQPQQLAMSSQSSSINLPPAKEVKPCSCPHPLLPDPPTKPTSLPAAQETPSPQVQTPPPDTNERKSRLFTMFDRVYTQTTTRITINLPEIPVDIKIGLQMKVKFLVESIFKKNIHPDDIIIAFRQQAGAPLCMVNG